MCRLFWGVHQQRPHKKMISKTQQNPRENHGLNEEKWMESMFLSNTSGLIIQPKIDAKRLQTWKCWEKLSTTSLRRSACEEYRWKNEQIYSYRQYVSISLQAAIWLVVSTPLKNISQMGLLFPTEWKNMFQTTNQKYIYIKKKCKMHVETVSGPPLHFLPHLLSQ